MYAFLLRKEFSGRAFPELLPWLPHAFAANITLSFTYPIQLDLLAKALKLTPASGQTITVLPCQPPEVLLPLAGAKAAEVIRKAPLNCALVQLRPGLPLATSAKLELPAGSKYNDVAGALGQAQTVQVKRGYVVRVQLCE